MNNSKRMTEALKDIAEFYQTSIQESIEIYNNGGSVPFEQNVEALITFGDSITRMDCIFNDSLTDEDDALCLTTLLYYQNMRRRIESTVEQYTEILKIIDDDKFPDNAEELVARMMTQGVDGLKKYAKIIVKGSDDDS